MCFFLVLWDFHPLCLVLFDCSRPSALDGESFLTTLVVFPFFLGWYLAPTMLLAGEVVWELAGTERVVIDRASVRGRRGPFEFGRTQSFDLVEVRNVRASSGYDPDDIDEWLTDIFKGPFRVVPGSGDAAGTVEFDYRGEAYRFGVGLDPAEAGLLVEAINKWVATASSSAAVRPVHWAFAEVP